MGFVPYLKLRMYKVQRTLHVVTKSRTYLTESRRLWHTDSLLACPAVCDVACEGCLCYPVPYMSGNTDNRGVLCKSVANVCCMHVQNILRRTWRYTTSSYSTHREIKVTLTLALRWKIYPTWVLRNNKRSVNRVHTYRARLLSINPVWWYSRSTRSGARPGNTLTRAFYSCAQLLRSDNHLRSHQAPTNSWSSYSVDKQSMRR